MRNSSLAALVAILTLSSTHARAQDAETIADVHCVIVGAVLAGKTDTTQRAAGSLVAMYYIGRLDGRVPKLDLEELMIKESKAMTSSDFAAEAKRCGATLTARGQELTKIGKDMVEQAQKTSGEQPK